jgi:hypothetical protein
MVCDVVLSDTQVPTSWWNLAFPSSGLEGKNSRILVSWRGGQPGPPIYLGLSTKHGVKSRDFILHKLKSPVTYHMPRFNMPESQGHRTAHGIPQKIYSKFLTSQNTWWCPPFEPVQHWEFIAVVCSDVTLIGGYGYKWCQHLLRKWNYSFLK